MKFFMNWVEDQCSIKSHYFRNRYIYALKAATEPLFIFTDLGSMNLARGSLLRSLNIENLAHALLR